MHLQNNWKTNVSVLSYSLIKQLVAFIVNVVFIGVLVNFRSRDCLCIPNISIESFEILTVLRNATFYHVR